VGTGGRSAAALAALLTWHCLSPAAAASPSFNCTGTLTATERAICSDASLAALDVALAAAYQKKFDSLPKDTGNALDETRAGLAFTQKAWLAHRNDCGADKTCIRKAYVLRTGALTAPDNAKDVPCRDTVGTKQAAIFVQQCIAVATETHPPCNADNSCELILSHNIFRCAGLGDQTPKFCAAYPQP
jgi:uncharacterized protein